MLNKNTTLVLFILSLLLFITITACKKTKESPPTPTAPIVITPVDTCKNITYSNAIAAIVTANCTNGCHIPSNRSGNLLLNSKTNVENAIKNKNLLGRINNSGSPMPPSGKMADSTIKKFDCWKEKNYPN